MSVMIHHLLFAMLELLTCDLFIAHFVDCHFDEIVFLPLVGDKNVNIFLEHRNSHIDGRRDLA